MPHALSLPARQRPRIRVGVSSDTRGWGAFAVSAMAKETLVGEYVGESISPAEADARGAVYDARHHSFLFEASRERVLDATRVGNKTRWMNHDPPAAATCAPRVVRVRGENRILLFTKRDVPAGGAYL